MPDRSIPPAVRRPPRHDTRHQSILLVEDDDDIREAMTVFLETEGYDVLQARDGDDALRKLRADAKGVCLVLLDLFMPVKNGWEFRAEQIADPAIADVPVVVVSADRNARDRAATLGALDYLVKPIDFDRLLGIEFSAQ